MATPFVTGYFALLKEAYPLLTASELRAKMSENIADLGSVGRDYAYGFGLPQAFLNPTAPSDPTTPPSEPTPSDPELTLQGQITTDKTIYYKNDRVLIQVTAFDGTNTPLANAKVVLTISAPLKSRLRPVTVQLVTNSVGVATYSYYLTSRMTKGTYQVSAEITYLTYTKIVTTRFQFY